LCVSAAAVLTATHTPSLHDALPIHDECGTVDDAGRITTVVDVVDLLDPVVLLQGDGVEPAHVADHRERRLEPTEGLGCRAGPHVLVPVEDRDAVDVLDGDDGLVEAPLVPRLRRQSL